MSWMSFEKYHVRLNSTPEYAKDVMYDIRECNQ
jgi:hypothetical protein